MATRILEYTIPTSFQRLDSTITGTDRFVNVRDMQVLRKNANILSARRARQPLITCCTQRGDLSGGGRYITCRSVVQPTAEKGDTLIACPILVSYYAQSCTFVIRADRKVVAGPDVDLYPCFSSPTTAPAIDFTNKIAVSFAVPTKYTTTVPIPEWTGPFSGGCNGRRLLWFFVFYGTSSSGGDILGGHANVTRAVSNWVEGVGGAARQYTMMYFPSDTSIGERLVLVSGNNWYLVDRPFNKTPTAGVDTFNFRLMQELEVYDYDLYEDAVTDFGAEVDLP